MIFKNYTQYWLSLACSCIWKTTGNFPWPLNQSQQLQQLFIGKLGLNTSQIKIRQVTKSTTPGKTASVTTEDDANFMMYG